MPDSHAQLPACESNSAKVAPTISETPSRKEKKEKLNKTRRKENNNRTRDQEPGILYLTQNVRGMLKENAALDSWFDGLRQRTDLGFVDIALLQETRATEKWRESLKRKYAAGWGLRAEEHLEHWSFWGPTPRAAAGVAILVRPGGRVTNPRPIGEEQWSELFMAIQFDVEGETHTILNVYGPTDQHARETIYAELAGYERPHGPFLLGGDFNCTLDDSLDRSHSTHRSHDSTALHELLRHWKLHDVLDEEQDQISTERARREFHAARHTYRYKLDDGELATSRLDRFYVDHRHTKHVRQVEVVTPPGDSDHDGVLVFKADAKTPPARRRRKARPRLRYPLPFGTQQAVQAISERLLQQAVASSDKAPAVTAHEWTLWKTELRQQCLQEIRVTTKRQTRAHKQRRRRLLKAMRAILPATCSTSNSVSGTIDGITRAMEGLTIDGYTRVHAIRAELVRLTKNRSRRRRRERFAKYAHGTPGAERAFFKRFQVRQGHRQAASLPHDPNGHENLAERLATDWAPITQRGNRNSNSVQDFLESLPKPTRTVDLSALDDPFTEEEVGAAITACPRRKAPGPDGIPNDWYRDHAEQLTPLLTKLFNEWHRSGVLPVSFRQALVACIPKTSRPRSGLDYRPIALLDTDYKIYARLLLNRIRPACQNWYPKPSTGSCQGDKCMTHSTFSMRCSHS
jgi:exonuclease III